MLHFIVSLLLAIIASAIIANAIYNLMPDNPGARTATAYGAALFVTLAIGVWKEAHDRKQAITSAGKTLRPTRQARSSEVQAHSFHIFSNQSRQWNQSYHLTK